MTPNSTALSEVEEKACFRDLNRGSMFKTDPQTAVDLRIVRTWNRIKRVDRRRGGGYIYALFERHVHDPEFFPPEMTE